MQFRCVLCHLLEQREYVVCFAKSAKFSNRCNVHSRLQFAVGTYTLKCMERQKDSEDIQISGIDVDEGWIQCNLALRSPHYSKVTSPLGSPLLSPMLYSTVQVSRL